MRQTDPNKDDQSPTLRARLKTAVFGLQCKSTLLVAGVTLGVSALVGGLFFHLSGQLTSRLETEHSVRLCALLADLAAEPAAAGDRETLARLAREFSTGDPLLFVAFTDATGDLMVSSGKGGLPVDSTLMPEPVIQRTAVGKAIYREGPDGGPTYHDITYPIRKLQDPADQQSADHSLRSTLVGYARVGFNLEPTLRAYASVTDLVSGIGMAIVLITVPLAFLVVRRTVVPLNELTRVARRLAQGDLTARSAIKRTDEIGQLADALNGMAGEIARSSREVLSMNTTLEERVKQRTHQLREMAARDPLTGLYNRRHLNEVLTQQFAEAKRYGTPLSCTMIDLDNFKHVNDRHGHQAGDDVLVLVAFTIVSQLRAADVAARYGGDEFVVLLPHTTTEQAQSLSERIVDKLAADLAEHLPGLTLSMSIGLASLDQENTPDADTLIRNADHALYAAKKSGRNRVRVAEPVV